MQLALQEDGTRMHLKVSLTCFKKKDLEVYRLALGKLDGVDLPSYYLCNGPGCVYSTARPGTPARAVSDFCRWCDADVLGTSKNSIRGRRLLNEAVTAFYRYPAVYEAALAKVGADFVRASQYCCSTSCVFSYKNHGKKARARLRSDLCFWCSPDVVTRYESTRNGIRKIAMHMRKFSTTRVEVFQVAISRLPYGFLQGLRVCSQKAEQYAMLKEDHVEQDALGKFYVYDPEYLGAVDKAIDRWLDKDVHQPSGIGFPKSSLMQAGHS
jgi:hypothetical protein